MHPTLFLAAALSSVLLPMLPTLIGGAVMLIVSTHALLKLAAFLDAKAQDAHMSKAGKMAMLGIESLARSLDHFLEQTQGDYAGLADATKRAAALKHLEDTAKSDALPAAGDALKVLGSSWLTGAASQVINAAVAKGAPASPPAP